MTTLSAQQRRALLALLETELARAEAASGTTAEELARARSVRAELLRLARLGGASNPGGGHDLQDGGGDPGELDRVRD